MGQTRTQTDGCAERRARGWPGWGWRGQQGIRLRTEEGTGGPLQAWGAGAPSSGASSHQLGFCIKLEILDGLVVLDAGLQFHHLVLKLNTAPHLWARTQGVCSPGGRPHPSHLGQEALSHKRVLAPGWEPGASLCPVTGRDSAVLRAALSRVAVDMPQRPGVHVGAPTGTPRGRGVQSQQQDAWLHEPCPTRQAAS